MTAKEQEHLTSLTRAMSEESREAVTLSAMCHCQPVSRIRLLR